MDYDAEVIRYDVDEMHPSRVRRLHQWLALEVPAIQSADCEIVTVTRHNELGLKAILSVGGRIMTIRPKTEPFPDEEYETPDVPWGVEP